VVGFQLVTASLQLREIARGVHKMHENYTAHEGWFPYSTGGAYSAYSCPLAQLAQRCLPPLAPSPAWLPPQQSSTAALGLAGLAFWAQSFGTERRHWPHVFIFCTKKCRPISFNWNAAGVGVFICQSTMSP